MLTNLQTLLLGALIGFVASTLTTILNHILEKGRNSQNHKWELEEKAKALQREINNKRLDQLEEFVKGRYETFCQIYDLESNFLSDFKEIPDQEAGDVITNAKYVVRKLHTLFLVNNNELNKNFNRLEELVIQEIENFQRNDNEYKAGKLDQNKELNLLPKNRDETAQAYANIIRIIDNLRNK
jgi:hypothetical protein